MKIRVAAVLTLPLLLCSCMAVEGAAQGSAGIPATVEQPASAQRPAGALDWPEARASLGSDAVVCGPVVSTFTAANSEGSPTFINIGRDYPDDAGVTVIIFDDYRDAFPFDPAAEYDGTEICASGHIRAHREFVQIEARNPDQLAVIG